LKINKIEVKKLFGVFDHEISLRNESNITIVIGENGLGKTVILEAINSFFSGEYYFFVCLEFEVFKFYFDNNEIWSLTKSKYPDYCALYISRNNPENAGAREKRFRIYSEEISNKNRLGLRDEELQLRELSWNTHNIWWRNNNGLNIDDSLYLQQLRYEQIKQLNLHKDTSKSPSPPQWFVENVKKIHVKLIETQRIITAKERGSDAYVSAVNKCSEEIKDMILKAIKGSSEVTLILDSTYPTRLVKKLIQGSDDSLVELNTALANLDNRRRLFSSVGLVVDSKDTDILQIDEDQKHLINVLKLYIDDSHKKLDPYQELFEKIKLFKEIINKRFKHKKLNILKDKGLIFNSTVIKNDEDKFEEIPAEKLSSGEQNELILFYRLIFHSQSGDMILIDEPELSLHISWQNKFINDLKDVTSINGVSIIIATHSPDIINDNWDLKVELLGVE